MAYPGDIVGSDIENLNLDPFPRMAYEPFMDENGNPTIRYAQIATQTKIYVKHGEEEEEEEMLPGMIILWHGTIATIPTGFALCDGTNGTPDLRNRFIVCANADSGAVAKTTITGSPLQSGGAATHDHTGVTDGHYHLYGADVPVPSDTPSFTAWDSALKSTTETDTFLTDPPQGAADAALPPFYALAYIMKL